ncbi:hypothetical protein B565_0973 [Aeromonas veronii B565]|nr:hypothetical protein B565_0973 [Aeromonas veronii B565]
MAAREKKRRNFNVKGGRKRLECGVNGAIASPPPTTRVLGHRHGPRRAHKKRRPWAPHGLLRQWQ